MATSPHVVAQKRDEADGKAKQGLEGQQAEVDGNGGKDNRIRDPLRYVEDFNGGNPSTGRPPLDRSLRTKVFQWYTNFNPYFLDDHPQFVPQPDTLILDPVFNSRLFMSDPDSLSGGVRAPFLVRVRFVAPNPAGGQDIVTAWQPGIGPGFRLLSGDEFPILIPPGLPSGQAFFEFELSDLPTEVFDDRRIDVSLY